MEKSDVIKNKYHKTLNTFFLFETILYTEFSHKYLISSSTYNHEDLGMYDNLIDYDFLKEVFNEVWLMGNNVDINPKASEDFIYDVISITNESTDHFKLMKELDCFDIDFKLLDKIKEYCFNILNEHDKHLKIKYLYKNYIIFIKNSIIDSYKIAFLVSEDNFCLN